MIWYRPKRHVLERVIVRRHDTEPALTFFGVSIFENLGLIRAVKVLLIS